VAFSSLQAQVVAVDDASRYSFSTEGVNRWMSNGHRGDLGFGVWEFEAVPHGGFAGRFIGDSGVGAADINTDGKSFGIFAHPASSPTPYAAAVRRFDKPVLTTGDSITFKVAVNFRNGNKGFSVRSASGVGLFNFNVGTNSSGEGGYIIRNGVNGTPTDGGQRFGGYHADTVFTFTFTQQARQMDWVIERSGGLSGNVSGNFPASSGTVADIRFYISGTDDAGLTPANNLYFNSFVFTPAVRGDAPLTPGERRMPGFEPSYILRYQDPSANTVTVRHSGDSFAISTSMTKNGDVWELDIRDLELAPGWHTFKFRPNSEWEADPNRRLYLDPDGRIALPPAVYLTWQRDPTTTMTVQWYNTGVTQNQVRFRFPGVEDWNTLTGSTEPFPHTERLIHTAEITGLVPDTSYEFEVDGYDDTFKFRTMPASLDSRPVKIGIGGDVDVGARPDAMTAAIAAKDPDFLVVGGDHAYEDARAENFWRWYRYMDSWFTHARAPDGRMLPLVMGIGNHEVRYGYSFNHPDFDDSAAWRDRYGAYFYRSFAFPGPEIPYGVLDFGKYLSLVILDTEHSSPIITGSDPQSQWLVSALDARRDVQHLFPIYHVPAYPSVRSFNDANNTRIRQRWVPLFEQAGVKLAFEHHDHTFKRTRPLLGGAENADGIVFLGDGLWGIGNRAPDTGRWYLEAANQRHHVHLVTLTATNRTVEAVDTQGDTFGGQLVQPIDGIPSAPEPVITELQENVFSFTWSSVPRADKYKVIRSDGIEVEVNNGTSYADPEWTPSSGFTYVVEAINRAGHSRTNPSTAPAPRQVWALTNDLPWDGSGEGDMMADPNRSGRPNILEYFHGLNPRVANGINPLATEVNPDSGELVLRFRHNRTATDVQGRVVWKSDLAAPGPWLDSDVAITAEGPDPTDSGVDWFRASVPIEPDDSRKFLRLEVSESD